MSKKLFSTALLVFLTTALSSAWGRTQQATVTPADGETQADAYSMLYLKEHLLYQQADEVNVIDADIEWPEAADGADLRPLQAFIAQRLMGTSTFDLGLAYDHFKQSLGTPVTQQFATLPDDAKTSHHRIALKLLGREPGRFLSFLIYQKAEAGQQARHTSGEQTLLVTYDLLTLEVLQRDDLLRRDRIANGFSNYDDLLPAIDYTGSHYTGLSVVDACLLPGKVLLSNTLESADDVSYDYSLKLSTESMAGYLTKKARNLLKPLKKSATQATASGTQHVSHGPSHLPRPGTFPVFQVPGKGLGEYLSEALRPVADAIDESQKGLVTTLLTIDEEGITRDIRIVQPLSPAYDREAVRVVRSLPRWQPAKTDGEKVAAQVSIGIRFEE